MKVQVAHPYSSTNTATAWKKSCFILSEIKFLYDQQLDNSSLCLPYAYGDIAFSRRDITTKVCELVNKFQRLAT